MTMSGKFQFLNKFSSKATSSASTSVPLLPSSTTSPSSTGTSISVPAIVGAGPEIVRFKNAKRRGKKYNLGGFGGPPGSNGPTSYESFIKENPSPSRSLKGILSVKESVNLFSIYGNILANNQGLAVRYQASEKATSTITSKYPLDECLMALLENSTRFWYSNSKKLPSILSIHTPSRASTWDLARHLSSKIGNSNLVLVPVSLFHELFQTCMTHGGVGDARKSQFTLNNSSSPSALTSRSAILVLEYLFTCAEASMGGRSLGEKETYTLLLDGIEEFLLSRKGGEAVLKEISNWSNSVESFNKRIILGGRSANLVNEEVMEEESENPPDEEAADHPSNTPSSVVNFSNSNNNNTNNNNKSSSNNSAFQAITEFIIKAAGSKPIGGDASNAALFSNVRLDCSLLRLFINGPKGDKRKLLKYSQKIGEDRRKDIFDGNLFLLRSVAGNRWKIKLNLGISGKYDFPSNNCEIWDALSCAGKGVLTKRKLHRDEVNEIFMYALGHYVHEGTSLDVGKLAEAIESVSILRHDPTRFSSDDLAHLLAERHISMNSLSKYEKRFINCISTATTQTRFDDISLPHGTVDTLRSLTSLPLSHPELFTQGVLKNSLTGVLLFGPPGTGKTMLARAVAQESGAVFLAVNMSNIFDMWVGEGEKNVKGMFNLARKLSPSIIFIDEIDALLERRSSISGRSSRLEIVNEFMSQWDGLSSNLNSGVIVMGATNRPFVLDDAVLRRLPRRLMIDLPGSEDRLKILLNLLRENLCSADLLESLPEIARKMEFYSGSDLKNVAISAALKSAMRLAQGGVGEIMIISKIDFEEAIREVPASLSDQMDSLIELRKWNQTYGETKKGDELASQRKFGFA